MPGSVIDQISFSAWEKVFSIVGTAAASIIAAVGFVAKRWSNMEDTIEAQDRRIARIEETYVSRDDLREVFDDLQKDVNQGFTRAHQRMDQLFTQLGSGPRTQGRDNE